MTDPRNYQKLIPSDLKGLKLGEFKIEDFTRIYAVTGGVQWKKWSEFIVEKVGADAAKGKAYLHVLLAYAQQGVPPKNSVNREIKWLDAADDEKAADKVLSRKVGETGEFSRTGLQLIADMMAMKCKTPLYYQRKFPQLSKDLPLGLQAAKYISKAETVLCLCDCVIEDCRSKMARDPIRYADLLNKILKSTYANLHPDFRQNMLTYVTTIKKIPSFL